MIETITDGTLGGCSLGECGDPFSWVPELWELMLEHYEPYSILDLGCGIGYSTAWFESRVERVLGIEGSPMVASRAVCKNVRVHDFEIGQIRNLDAYDLCWCSEFLEHVRVEHEPAVFEALKLCRTIAVTAAAPGHAGHNHVNCRPLHYWMRKFEENGFAWDKTMTEHFRGICEESYQFSYFGSRGMIFNHVD